MIHKEQHAVFATQTRRNPLQISKPSLFLKWFLIMASLLLLTSCAKPAQAPAAPEPEVTEPPAAETPTEVPSDPAQTPLIHDNADTPKFGYGDLQGIYAILLADPKTIKTEAYQYISLSGGTLTRVDFEGIQPPGPNDNVMDISSNFKQRPGAVYRLSTGKIPENDSVTFMTENFVSQRNFYTLTKVGTISTDTPLRQRIEAERKLVSKFFWHLYDLGDNAGIYLIQFEPLGDQVLLSLVLRDKADNLWYAYFPATYLPDFNLYSWRVDDGGEIHPENFIVGWAADFSAAPELALYWRGAEGELLYWLRGNNGALEKGFEGYRYWGAY